MDSLSRNGYTDISTLKMNETILGTNFILLDMGRDSKKKNTGLPGANFDMTLI